MRATLWSGSGETSAVRQTILQDVFAAVGIPLDVVTTQEDLLAAARHARRASDRDFLLIDCALGEPSDVDRCVAVATSTPLPLHIIHPHEETFCDIERAAGRPLAWLPASFSVDVLLAKLHALQAQASTPSAVDAPRPVLTPREREVYRRVGAGQTVAAIGAQLGIAASTVKTHLANARRKLPPAGNGRPRADRGAAQ